MYKLAAAAALLMGSTTMASAQSTVIKANIFSPLVKTGSFFVEHKISEHHSLQLGALYTNWGTDGTGLSGFAVTPEYRLYLSDSKPALEGFYVGPFLRYQNLTLSTTYDSWDGNGSTRQEKAEAALNTYGGGVVAGYQVLFKRRFSLDSFLGPSYNGGHIRVRESSSGLDEKFDAGVFTGFGLRAGLTFGIAF